MARRAFGFWDYAFIAVLAVAVPAGIFHLVEGRYGQAIMALLAIIAGLVVVRIGMTTPAAPPPRRRVETAPPEQDEQMGLSSYEETRGESGRINDWLPLSIVSGFAATGVMSALLVIAYLLSATIGTDAPGASPVRGWFQALVDNTLAETARANLALTLVIHFLAGVAWAAIYAYAFEPRVSGPGWRRGVIFSLIPWAVSLAIFFPLSGSGILGLGLDAGPLPIIGNLLLHLAYGLVLGEVYASNRLATESGRAGSQVETSTMARSQRVMAASIFPGLLIGGILGALASEVIAPGVDTMLVAVIGAITGSVVGILIGSFFGLSPATSEH